MRLFKLEYTNKARKNLNRIPEKWRARIIQAIELLATNPYLGKSLKGEFKDKHSLRVWPYRIIYQVHQKEVMVIIVNIGHRQSVYNN